MDVWHFTEMPYPHLPPIDTLKSMRVTLPSRHYDPRIGADLYNRYLDEYMIADDLGFHHMVNEHHQTATCLDVAAPLSAAILARQTRKGRICILGNPVANRGDPLRIAEEMAMIDCISRGRLDVGFVRGVPYEIFAANTNPTQTVERLWEGIDLAVKAWPDLRQGQWRQRRRDEEARSRTRTDDSLRDETIIGLDDRRFGKSRCFRHGAHRREPGARTEHAPFDALSNQRHDLLDAGRFAGSSNHNCIL